MKDWPPGLDFLSEIVILALAVTLGQVSGAAGR